PEPLSTLPATPRPEPKRSSTRYAPFGRLIPCQTVITVDSASIQTPIIGLVTENIYHAGRLIIRAGTEVHGTAQTDRSRERIASGTYWLFVYIIATTHWHQAHTLVLAIHTLPNLSR